VLLIDCYNLLHTPMPQPLAGLDEAALVKLLAGGPWRGAIVVCDGVEKPHAPTSLGADDVELRYAGAGRTADEVIIALIDGASAPRQTTVVSNDRQIRKAAARRRAKALTCETFIGQLGKIAARQGRPARAVRPLPTDADYWLREFGLADQAAPTHRDAAPEVPMRRDVPTVMLWKRLDCPGHDHVRLQSTADGHELVGVALFHHEQGPCRLDYQVHCNGQWRTHRAVVRGVIGHRGVDVRITADGPGRWLLNERHQPQVDGCIDVDLSFTPATNLPLLRRLALAPGADARIRSAWWRVLEQDLAPLEQRYRRLADAKGPAYRYDAPTLGFTTTLRVDEAGFVTHYPGLWEAVAAL
jgi:hypothetical protein